MNLPEVRLEVADEGDVTAEGATLCDICLAVPAVREWEDRSEVSRLCKVVF